MMSLRDDADRALCSETLRMLSNPEGINQYTGGGGKVDPEKSVVSRRSETNVRVTHPDKPGHMVSITSFHSIVPGPRGSQHSDSYHVRHFGPGQTYKQSTHVSSHETLPKAIAAAKEHLSKA